MREREGEGGREIWSGANIITCASIQCKTQSLEPIFTPQVP